MSLSDKWRALGLPWMPGMLTTSGARAYKVRWDGMLKWVVDDWLGEWVLPEGDEEIDWTDPATVGCLLKQAAGQHQRIGQVISNAFRGRGDLFYATDVEFVEALFAVLETEEFGVPDPEEYLTGLPDDDLVDSLMAKRIGHMRSIKMQGEE